MSWLFNPAYAASQGECVAREFLAKINEAIFYPLIIFLTALALLLFLWGAFRYVLNAEDSGAREKGRKHMMYGVIGLLVMTSALAILTIAANTFGLSVDYQGRGNPCTGGGVYEPLP